MVLDPGIKPRGMQQNAIDYDGPISIVGDAKAIAYNHWTSPNRDGAAAAPLKDAIEFQEPWNSAANSTASLSPLNLTRTIACEPSDAIDCC
jgi:hypothetical protein